MNKWDTRFLDLAKYVAQWSKDTTKVGACVVAAGGKNQVAFGYNGFPPGIEDTEERLNTRELKLIYVQHAEVNALDNAGFIVKGSTLYTTKFPCINCAKSIISRGVKKVVTVTPDVNELNWGEESKYALHMFKEVGIILQFGK